MKSTSWWDVYVKSQNRWGRVMHFSALFQTNFSTERISSKGDNWLFFPGYMHTIYKLHIT